MTERTTDVAIDVESSILERHLAQVIEQARAIAPALRAYTEELPAGSRRRQLVAVLQILERGNAVEATSELRRLPAYWIPLLSAASATHDSGRVLSEFLKESQQVDDLRRQWWLALTYPLLLLGMATAVMVALSFLVVPVFREIFTDFQLSLPGFTRFVISVAEWIADGRLFIAAAMIVVVFYVLLQTRRLFPRSLRETFDDRFGTPFRRGTALARFTRFLADLLEADLDVTSALRIAGFTVESSRLRRAAWNLARDMETRSSPQPISYRPILTATVLHGLTGNLPKTSQVRLLREISENYAERVRNRLSWTRGVIEPGAIVLIGVVVGGTVIGLFLPLIQLIHGLSGG